MYSMVVNLFVAADFPIFYHSEKRKGFVIFI